MKAFLVLSGIIMVIFSSNAQERVTPNKQQLILGNYDSTYCRFFASDSFAFKNVVYSKEYFVNDSGCDEYVVKKTNYLNHIWAMRPDISSFNIDIYGLHPTKLIESITKRVDEVFIDEDFISTLTYGCCDANDSGELSTIWENKTFLKYDTKYFQIDIDRGRIRLFFGYSHTHNQFDHTKGILYYIIATGKLVENDVFVRCNYTYRVAGKIIFKHDSRSKYSDSFEIDSFSRWMHLIDTKRPERISVGQNYEKLNLWDVKPTLNDINITPLQINLPGDTVNNFSIPIIHGYLFGDSVHTERTIYIK